MLVDTHCHIHEADYPLNRDEVMVRAHEAGVTKMICVGTSEQSSADAVTFAAAHNDIYASIGVHPHDTKDGIGRIYELARAKTDELATVLSQHARTRRGNVAPDSLHSSELAHAQTPSNGQEFDTTLPGLPQNALNNTAASSSASVGRKRVVGKIVAVGEIGLDYFYNHSSREVQIAALEAQIQLALDYDLPVIFHVRDAFADFWPIFDNFRGIRGELHSFTDTQANVEEGLSRGLYIGVNGISTFTKQPEQQEMFANIALERLLLETDAPFLTPAPKRGTVNEPAFVRLVAEYHANVRRIELEQIAAATSANAKTLFSL